MIVLANPSSYVYVQTTVAGALSTHAVYADWNGQLVTLGRESHNITDASAGYWIVSPPATGIQRNIKYIGVRFGFSNATVTTVHHDGTTWTALFWGYGGTGVGYSYTEGKGWQFLSGLGGLRRAWTV
jgi:hypothetical protein